MSDKMMTGAVLVILWAAFAQAAATSPMTLDFCAFRGEQGRVYLEVYIDHPRSTLTHISTDEGWYAALRMNLEMRRADQSVAKDSWLIEDLVDNPEAIGGAQRMLDARIYELNPGAYNLIVTARDSVSGKSWQSEPAVTVAGFPRDALNISDVELGSHLIPAEMQEEFKRGDFGLTPNPRRIFGGEYSFFIYYFEIYPSFAELNPPDPVDSSAREYAVERAVLNGLQDTVKTLPAMVHHSSVEAFADIDSVLLDDVPTGSYLFAVKVTGPDGAFVEKSTKFFVYQKDLPIPTLTASTQIIADPEEELEEIDFLLSRGQRKMADQMSREDKALFLENWWRQYDDNPRTPDVPVRRLFRQRVAEADERWDSYREPGHRTDLGRVYVLYGEPDHIERQPMDQDSKPYMVWHYDHLEGGVIFVFVDRSGLGEFQLVHSTRRGEISNADWYQMYVQRSGTSTER